MATSKSKRKPKYLPGRLIDHNHSLLYLPFNSNAPDNARKVICDQQAGTKFTSCKNYGSKGLVGRL
ncbi:MAG TPA: hypothetical protein VKA87_03580 [Nitrososphaeraceae archaeon]|nr:hypothetical protein [Nitrososphaeraceae archaeon]